MGTLIEWLASLLLLACIAILFSGVVARYMFNSPIVWSDELASILFLWLAMLGSIIALRRAEHMRMTAWVSALSGHQRVLLENLACSLHFFICSWS